MLVLPVSKCLVSRCRPDSFTPRTNTLRRLVALILRPARSNNRPQPARCVTYAPEQLLPIAPVCTVYTAEDEQDEDHPHWKYPPHVPLSAMLSHM